MKRVKTRSSKEFSAITASSGMPLSDSVDHSGANETHTVDDVPKFEQAAGTACSNLELACAQASAAKTRFEGYRLLGALALARANCRLQDAVTTI